ncbi:hypothetical protein SEVIR_1G096650v4 [Setaria viridis]
MKITEAQGQRKAEHWKPQDIEFSQVAAADSDLQQKNSTCSIALVSGQENTKLASHKRLSGWIHLTQSKFFQQKRSLAASISPRRKKEAHGAAIGGLTCLLGKILISKVSRKGKKVDQKKRREMMDLSLLKAEEGCPIFRWMKATAAANMRW